MKNAYLIKETIYDNDVDVDSFLEPFDVDVVKVHVFTVEELQAYVSEKNVNEVIFLHKVEDNPVADNDILLFIKDSVTDKPIKIESIKRYSDEYHGKANYIVKIDISSARETDKEQPNRCFYCGEKTFARIPERNLNICEKHFHICSDWIQKGLI